LWTTEFKYSVQKNSIVEAYNEQYEANPPLPTLYVFCKIYVADSSRRAVALRSLQNVSVTFSGDGHALWERILENNTLLVPEN
jgi:hypothetical protein